MDDLEMERARELLKDLTQDENTFYVICPWSMGDFLIAGGLCHALVKKKGKPSCTIIALDRFANCGFNFVGVSEIRYIPADQMKIFKDYICETGEYETANYFYAYFRQRGKVWGRRFIVNAKFDFMKRYKANIFGLPLDTEFIPPTIDPPPQHQKQRLHETYTLDKKRTIILAPYAKSFPALDEIFWIRLISKLKQKNNEYVFYTNVATPAEKVIPGTALMPTTLPELMYLAEKVNCFIGIRSGLFDLLAFTNARLLYINKNIRELWDYDLKANFNHTNSRAFYLANISEQINIQAFMKQNNIRLIDELLFYDYVKGSDVAFDAESLLKKIVDSVD